MVFSQSSTSINNPSISYSDDTHRSSRDSGGDSRDSRRRSVFDVLKRSRSVSAAPPDNRSIPGQYPESSTTPPLATVDTQILRHRTRLSPGLTAENIKAGGQSRLGGILRRRDASPTESTPGATPDTQKAQSSSNNSPYLSRFIGTEDSESESDGESIYQTSEDPPRLLFPLTRSRSNSMTTFMRSFNFDGTRDSPPRPLPSPTRSQTSFVLVEHEARRIQDQDSHLPTSLPPVSREVTRDRTAEASERKEFVPGRKSPQEVLSSMGVYRRETQEGSPLWTGGSATVIGTQQRQQRHEPDPPPTPSSSKVPWDAERNIQGYIDDIDTSHSTRSGASKVVQ
ncbi:hypothetical protein BJ322DRAFT_1036872 [Thelephora terrestris]|uniref:Uncharacterized protein n=1 Tax=Thelephora terrestris TaxID=56493 RepID=A0A9P6LA66_9AGAM|nr:hypothetical protein BJ322DRAFT_1036872 [Thelephora terrestris]